MLGKKHAVALSVALLLGGTLAWAADDSSMTGAPATQPSSETPMPHHRGRLVRPYSQMTDLSDDQKMKLEEIHADALAKMEAIRDKERADSLAVLNDDQKVELNKLEDEAAAAAKERSAARKKKADAAGAATAPAQ